MDADQDQPKYVFAGYVDLDTEEVYEPDGTRLTNERAEQIAEETLAEVRTQRGT